MARFRNLLWSSCSVPYRGKGNALWKLRLLWYINRISGKSVQRSRKKRDILHLSAVLHRWRQGNHKVLVYRILLLYLILGEDLIVPIRGKGKTWMSSITFLGVKFTVKLADWNMRIVSVAVLDPLLIPEQDEWRERGRWERSIRNSIVPSKRLFQWIRKDLEIL